MIRFRLRKASIDPELRLTLERLGQGCMQQVLASTNQFRHNGQDIPVRDRYDEVASWLTEEHDRVERKETWSLAMEMAITVFVALELIFAVLDFFGLKLKR